MVHDWSTATGFVYVNGKLLNEPYIQNDRRDSRDYGPIVIPKDEYFVMGDNRSQSCDSREWKIVPRANIIGQVVKVVRAGS